MDELLRTVDRVRTADTQSTFDRRVAEQADRLRTAIETGQFDSDGFAVGLEVECYAVDGERRLIQLPDTLFETADCNREIGLHNLEINASPQRFDPEGVEAQSTELAETVAEICDRLASTGTELVLDGMWTVPPRKGSQQYLGAVEQVDGTTVAKNMPDDPRYCAMDNVLVAAADGEISISVPGASHTFPTILVESLTSSIQPHLQVPEAEAFPDYFNAAIRTLGPVLALSTNSPFLPSDLYNEVDDPHRLVAETHHELRIPIFEKTVNLGDHTKACCPDDIDSPTDIVDRVVEDWTCGPFLQEWETAKPADTTAVVDAYWEFSHKYGTYWRWIRSIIGNDAAGSSDGSLRIEYRPLPTQPTVKDVCSLHWLTTGLIRGLVAVDHPALDVDYDDAHASFYNAVTDGLDAELHWRTANGEPTTDLEEIYPDLFSVAHQGLCQQGHTDAEADRLLAPMVDRWERRETPSQWKKARVRDALDDGNSLSEAITEMQTTYNRKSRHGEPFAHW